MLPPGLVERFQWDRIHILEQLNSRQSQVYTLVDDSGTDIEINGILFRIIKARSTAYPGRPIPNSPTPNPDFDFIPFHKIWHDISGLDASGGPTPFLWTILYPRLFTFI